MYGPPYFAMAVKKGTYHSNQAKFENVITKLNIIHMIIFSFRKLKQNSQTILLFCGSREIFRARSKNRENRVRGRSLK